MAGIYGKATFGSGYGGIGGQYGKPRIFRPKTAPAPTPAPEPVSPYVAPGPDESYKDSNYYNTDSQITQGLNNLRPYLLNQAQALGSGYGVDTTGADPTTYDPAHPPAFNVDWAHIDTTNPYSRAALLKQSYTQTSRGDSNRMAAAGQLYSGAYQNAQDADRANFEQGKNAVLTDFAQKYGGLYGQWQSAQANATGERIANTGNAITAHLNDPAPTPAAKPRVAKPTVKRPVMTAFGRPMFTPR